MKIFTVAAIALVVAACHSGGSHPPDNDRDGFAASNDCNDNDAAIHALMAYSARDLDGDKVLVPSAGSVCGNGATLPPTYFANAASGEVDCDDQDTSRWRLSSFYEDFDRDGVGHGSLLSLCSGNNAPPGFAASSFDCDDLSTTKWRMVATYSDVDGDGVGSGPILPECVGLEPPPGASFLGFDPLDTLTDPTSASVSDFDLNLPTLIIN